MIERVHAAIVRRRLLEPGMRVGAAVSGGADSMCLLETLAALAPRWRLELSVLHVDHGLRGAESDADAEFVREAAARLGLPAIVERAVPAARGNLEQAARQARREFFHRQAASGAVDRVATGHTLSDQAETVLFRLLRGAGGAGLAGIRAATREGLVRPLLDVTRDEVREWLAARGVAWREDSSNASLRFRRNRIRRQLLPQLEREWNPALAAALARTAEWAAGEEAYWEAQIERLMPLFERRGDALSIEACALRGLEPAVARRLLRRAMDEAAGERSGVGFEHVEAVRRLAEAKEGRGRVQAPGIEAVRSCGRLLLAKTGRVPAPLCDYSLPLAVPGSVALPCGGPLLCVELVEKLETIEENGCVYNGGMGCVDGERVGAACEVRNWRAGDRYQPVDASGERKIKTLFQEARIPLWERSGWPVIACRGRIVWTRLFGPAADVAARPSSRVVLTVRETACS